MDAAGELGDDAELAALRDVLAALGATAPRGSVAAAAAANGDVSALSAFLTAGEKYCRGIVVPVFDRFGRRFGMRLRKIQANRSYRFFGSEWERFVRDNHLAEGMAAAKGMGRELRVELWAFRSPELAAVGHNPDGALGMAILTKIKEKART
uniref:TF-B3 domain-containing protein n=1 Tax=Setaria viridis TaxID=4556 RepID=A0A4U6VDJ1_SETVI|nr:hypothetical protein SEVIR_3G263700v2 [Setaria viridis]